MDWELAYYKAEVVKAAQEIKHLTTTYSGPSHLQARAYQAQEKIQQHRRVALHILYELIKFYHYCFSREASIITDHKPLVAISKDRVNTILETTMNSNWNTPIQSQLYTYLDMTYCNRLAVQT